MKFFEYIFLIYCFSAVFASTGIRVDQNNQLLVDPEGHVRIYHGVNVVYKPFPYYPEYDGPWNPMNSFNQEDVQNLVDWGFNNVRLYVAWEGVEPIEGQYNQTYIDQITNIVEMCGQSNIDVYLDMHQDLYSNFFCGEGIPRWAVEKVISENEQDFPKPWNFDIKKDADGYPILEDCHKQPFFEYYFTYNVNTISQALITNVDKLTEKMGGFWEQVAKYFKDQPNILGYEFINEPWGVSIWDNPLSHLIPGYQNNNFLLPFYKSLNEKIRSVDRDSLIFFEPITWDLLNNGFETNVGGQSYQDREVLSYHIYCPLVNGDGEPISPLLCSIFDKFESNGKQKNYQKIGVAGWLTEFGALDNTEGSADEVDRLCGNADKILNGWSYWQYKYFDDITTAAQSPDAEGFWNSKGELQTVKVGALSRSYAQKVCGIPSDMSWNRKKETFKIKVEMNYAQCSNGSTQIYLSEYFWYQNGFEATFTGCDQCQLEAIGDVKGYYKVTGDNSVSDGNTWSLKVVPKK